MLNVQTVDEFPGLDLSREDQSRCPEANNVLIGSGYVEARTGYTASTDLTTAIADSMFGLGSFGAAEVFIVSAGTNLYVYDVNLALITVTRADATTGTVQAITGKYCTFAHFGDTSNEYVYVATNSTAEQVWRYKPSTATWSKPAGLSSRKGTYVAVSPIDNRLVITDETDTSKVWFSDPGAPETFGANNFLDFTPGDGEAIYGMLAWRELLFIFKRSKFFVVYGTSTDSTGNPIFNYRVVDAGIGLNTTNTNLSQNCCCVGPDALYMFTRHGIYKTTGGPPIKVFGALEGFFTGKTPPGWLGINGAGGTYSTLGSTPTTVQWASVRWIGNKFYVMPSGIVPLGGLFVYDAVTDAWVTWTFTNQLQALTSYRGTGDEEHLVVGLGTRAVARFAGNATDDGTAIAGRYRAGFVQPANGAEARVKDFILQGSGTITLKGAIEWGSLDTGSSAVLGTSPAIAEKRVRTAYRGRNFAWQASGSGVWNLQRLQYGVMDARGVLSK